MGRLFATILFSILLVKLSLAAIDPQRLTGHLTDRQKKPLPYANIGVAGSPVGTVADEQGQFTLYLSEKISRADTVVASLIGYRPLRMSVTHFVTILNVSPRLVLDEEVMQLREVRISAAQS